jgi:hypothetical protein
MVPHIYEGHLALERAPTSNSSAPSIAAIPRTSPRSESNCSSRGTPERESRFPSWFACIGMRTMKIGMQYFPIHNDLRPPCVHHDLRFFFHIVFVHHTFQPYLPSSQYLSMTRDNPDPKNIIPDDQKRMRNATDRAQGLDSYFKTVEATTKPRPAQG